MVSDSSKECVIIDCGAYYEEERRAIVDYIAEETLKPVHLLATHGHLDHNFGNNTIFEKFGLKPGSRLWRQQVYGGPQGTGEEYIRCRGEL